MSSSNPADDADDMSEYLQTFLDETEEQLDDLVESMLSLEKDSANREELNEAFRLIHSIKGSAGLMGLDQITVLTHHLENRFERFRSGVETLDDATMGLVLRCIDFLRVCVDRLREGDAIGSPLELLEELNQLERKTHAETNASLEAKSDADGTIENAAASDDSSEEQSEEAIADTASDMADDEDTHVRVELEFRDQLPLADLKAQLIVNRLTGLGDVHSTVPALEAISADEPLRRFAIRIATHHSRERLMEAADVEGVESIEVVEPNMIEPGEIEPDAIEPDESAHLADSSEGPDVVEEATSPSPQEASTSSATNAPPTPTAQTTPEAVAESVEDEPPAEITTPKSLTSAQEKAPAQEMTPVPENASAEKSSLKMSETMRVDIDRLDNLMNLAGELVVNRARFEQIADQISPSRGKNNVLNRLREFCDLIRRSTVSNETGESLLDRGTLVNQLRDGLEVMEDYLETWENDQRQIDRFGEAIDQLTRVSQSLQKGVLDTRMVPVAPLFNRFKRVVRDLSKERGKRVHLVIRGEKTELDKRMIDELGDPLVHLVRNSLDHGLESPEDRRASGKPEVGTISLEATHSGNNVIIQVRDDGRGIDCDRIRDKLVANGVVSREAADELSDEQALEFIWHPGFSTAREITDISGRGVGMDVVLSRIRRLNGNIDIQSSPGTATQFTIRLPLTLAIINCLLVRLRGIVFSIPIEDVREIVSVSPDDVISLRSRQAFDVRDEMVSLVSIDDVFDWNDASRLAEKTDKLATESQEKRPCNETLEVVILRHGSKTLGLSVDELLGSQDMVIKSLSDNFIDIRGLAGASILGDGSVCLMLDVATVFQIITQSSIGPAAEGSLT